jgi:hypothetical protein
MSERLQLKQRGPAQLAGAGDPAAPQGTIIVVDPLPRADNPAAVFYQSRPFAVAMTVVGNVISNDPSSVGEVVQIPGGGELLPRPFPSAHVSIVGSPRLVVWRITRGDGILIRDSKPTPGSRVENVLDSMFNNDFHGLCMGMNTINCIRHGDILALSNTSNVYNELIQRGTQYSRGFRMFLFVDDHPNHVAQVLRGGATLAGFRTRFERFFNNLSIPPGMHGTCPPNTFHTLTLDTKKNDAELMDVRLKAFSRAFQGWYGNRHPGRKGSINDVLQVIAGFL